MGASEHQKIMAQFGAYPDKALESYVRDIGQRVVKKTERPEVKYKFFVLDSPIVNAFALPGGYIYVSRGLLALANSEAELAAVLAHETGHITARHSAERYSTSVLTSLGASVISAAVDSSGVSQALGLGSNLYLASYSRGQENEADTLGLRYLSHGGYDADAMAAFLSSMQDNTSLEARLSGKASGFSYFSTHPATSERVANASAQARQYKKKGGTVGQDAYLNAISGMTYGDSAQQGFVRGQDFLHPKIGFAFRAPEGFRLINQPSQVVATSQSGAVVVFDMAANKKGVDPLNYLTKTWMKKEKLQGLEKISVNGMDAATGYFKGQVNGRAMTIQLMAIRWSNDHIVRFQVAIPRNASSGLVDGLKKTTYSFRRLSDKEKKSIKPYSVQIITAKAGDTVSSLARRQPFDKLQEERFRVLNGLKPKEKLVSGQRYKLISQ